MISKTSKRFRDMLAKLPEDIREQAKKAYQLFSENPSHPSLHFKKVHTTEPIHSARISKEFRAVGVVGNKEIIWFWIGPHDEYERLLKNLN